MSVRYLLSVLKRIPEAIDTQPHRFPIRFQSVLYLSLFIRAFLPIVLIQAAPFSCNLMTDVRKIKTGLPKNIEEIFGKRKRNEAKEAVLRIKPLKSKVCADERAGRFALPRFFRFIFLRSSPVCYHSDISHLIFRRFLPACFISQNRAACPLSFSSASALFRRHSPFLNAPYPNARNDPPITTFLFPRPFSSIRRARYIRY